MPAAAGMRLPPMPTIQDLIRVYKLGAKKKFSQNYLLDMNLNRKVVRSVKRPLADCHVLEVGPGPGGITRAVLDAGVPRLSVVELDRRFLPSLKLLNEASGNRMDIYQGDILRFPTDEIFPKELSTSWDSPQPNIHIIGNQPFSISTPLIIQWLRDISERKGAWSLGRVGLTLTFQKEVCERMIAKVQRSNRSRLSIMTQYLCHVHHSFTIPGSAFVPPPDVDVAVVSFTPRIEPLISQSFSIVEKVVRHVFHHRQKMCKRGVQTLFPVDDKHRTEFMFSHAEVSPDSRPFDLTMTQFSRLCDAYSILCSQEPELEQYDYRSAENAPLWRKSRSASHLDEQV